LEVKPAPDQEQPMSTDPLTLLDRLVSLANRPVADARLQPVATYLRSRRVYSALAIDQTLRSIGEGLSLAEMWWVDERDRDALGEILLGLDETDCFPGCVECDEEAAWTDAEVRLVGERN
jgi:hypothetical protein